MKRLRGLGGLALVMVGLLGCARDRPAESLIRLEIERTLPPHVRIASIETRFSPLTEIMGTTVPSGTWQVQVSADVVLTEALYRQVTSRTAANDPHLPADLKKDLERYHRLLEQVPDTRHVTVADIGPAPTPAPVLIEVQSAGLKTTLPFLVAATPVPSGWQIDILEGEGAVERFRNGRPIFKFEAASLRHGTEAQREGFGRSLRDLEIYRQEMIKLVSLQGEVDALNRRRDELKRERFREAYTKVTSLQQKRFRVVNKHNKDIARILALGTMANDFRERDGPMRDATAKHHAEMQRLDQEIAAAHNAASSTESEVDEDLNEQISALKVSAGLRQQRMANR